jgi:hypothetical protein
MEDVAVVSIFGTVGMLAAMAVVVGKLIAIYISMPVSAPTELVAKGVGFQVGGSKQAGCLGVWHVQFYLNDISHMCGWNELHEHSPARCDT